MDEMPDLAKASLNPPDIETLGGYLQASRLNRGMQLSDVSEQIKYHVDQLKAVEEQNWASLPSGFVLRSIVKKFAVAVGADPEIALEKLNQSTGNSAPVAKKNLKSSFNIKVNERLDDHLDDNGSGGTWLWVLLIIIVVGIVGYIAVTQGMISAEHMDKIKSWFGE